MLICKSERHLKCCAFLVSVQKKLEVSYSHEFDCHESGTQPTPLRHPPIHLVITVAMTKLVALGVIRYFNKIKFLALFKIEALFMYEYYYSIE